MARPLPPQSIRFCQSSDGVRIAYARHGQGLPLIISTCWPSHLEYDLESPIWRHWVDGMAHIATTIRYDERGFGLSDWEVPDFAFESRINDLEAVIKASGFDRFALLGMSQGGPTAIAYAVRHPERVTRLLLHGSYKELFGDRVTNVSAHRNTVTIDHFGEPSDFREYFKSHYGPTIAVYRFIGADPDRVAALDQDLDALVTRSRRRTSGAVMDWEYLLFTGTKA